MTAHKAGLFLNRKGNKPPKKSGHARVDKWVSWLRSDWFDKQSVSVVQRFEGGTEKKVLAQAGGGRRRRCCILGRLEQGWPLSVKQRVRNGYLWASGHQLHTSYWRQGTEIGRNVFQTWLGMVSGRGYVVRGLLNWALDRKEAGTSFPSSALASPYHCRRQGTHPPLLSWTFSSLCLSLCSLTLKFQKGASFVGDAAVGKEACSLCRLCLQPLSSRFKACCCCRNTIHPHHPSLIPEPCLFLRCFYIQHDWYNIHNGLLTSCWQLACTLDHWQLSVFLLSALCNQIKGPLSEFSVSASTDASKCFSSEKKTYLYRNNSIPSRDLSGSLKH